MKASRGRSTAHRSHVDDAASLGVPSGASNTFVWDVEEALTQVSYGLYQHISRQTRPDEAEMLAWWHQILNSQVAIAALEAECKRAVADMGNDDTCRRLRLALSRMSGNVLRDNGRGLKPNDVAE